MPAEMSISLKACIHTTDGLQHCLFRSSTVEVSKLVIIKVKEQGRCELQFCRSPAPATEPGTGAGDSMDLQEYQYALGGGLVSFGASMFRTGVGDLSVFQAGTLPQSCLTWKPGTQGGNRTELDPGPAS